MNLLNSTITYTLHLRRSQSRLLLKRSIRRPTTVDRFNTALKSNLVSFLKKIPSKVNLWSGSRKIFKHDLFVSLDFYIYSLFSLSIISLISYWIQKNWLLYFIMGVSRNLFWKSSFKRNLNFLEHLPTT